MPLNNEIWTRISVAEMHLEFLKAEATKEPIQSLVNAASPSLLSCPNLDDPTENLERSVILFDQSGNRHNILLKIPVDTVWYKVNHLKDKHLDGLRVLNGPWTALVEDRNELRKVAKREPNPWDGTPPANWPLPIIWGHSKQGPFAIIEGNHRLTAYVCGTSQNPPPPPLEIPCIVGISNMPCCWHIDDACPSSP